MLVGLSGGIACGKSTVLKAFAEEGAVVLSADDLVHSLMTSNGKAYSKIIKLFGDSIIGDDQEIDRKALGALVFGDSQLREQLELILHPLVYEAFLEWKEQNKDSFLVYEIPLLFEKNRERDFDYTVCVSSSQKTQVERLKSRNGLSNEEALSRIAAQLPLDQKEKRSDFVIFNEDIEFDELKQRVLEIIVKIQSS